MSNRWRFVDYFGDGAFAGLLWPCGVLIPLTALLLSGSLSLLRLALCLLLLLRWQCRWLSLLRLRLLRQRKLRE